MRLTVAGIAYKNSKIARLALNAHVWLNLEDLVYCSVFGRLDIYVDIVLSC